MPETLWLAPFMMNFCATRDRAKLANDQTVANERKVIENVAFKVLRVFRIT